MELFTHCLNPKKVFNRYTRHTEIVPCGECYACKNRHASVITKRVDNEIRSHRYSYMFTLTYDNDSIPRMELFTDSRGVLQIRPTGRLADSYTRYPLYYGDNDNFCNRGDKCKCETLSDTFIPCIENDDVVGEFGVVSKRDIQLFIKRLRKKIHEKEVELGQSMPIRYFVASEYGPKTFRPHYHGVIFFDNEVLTHILQGLIVASWGVFRRKKGKDNVSVFRPYARPALTSSYVKSCDPNTSFYVADYVSSNDSLPPVLRHPLTRPFYLCSQSPLIGSYQDNREKMLEDVRDGVATRVVERVNKKSECIEYANIPYSTSDLRSVFIKCKGFYALSSGAKLSLYSFVYDRYDDWQDYVKPYADSVCQSIGRFVRANPYFNFRNYCKRTSLYLYTSLELDEDINWYASLRACMMIRKYSIFGKVGMSCPMDGYLYMFHRAYSVIASYKLRCFHDNLSDWLCHFGVKSLVSAYPTLFDLLPDSLLDYHKLDNGVKRFIDDYGLRPMLYKHSVLDVDFLSSSAESNQDIYLSYLTDAKARYYRRSKQKKANNSLYQGTRKLD